MSSDTKPKRPECEAAIGVVNNGSEDSWVSNHVWQKPQRYTGIGTSLKRPRVEVLIVSDPQAERLTSFRTFIKGAEAGASIPPVDEDDSKALQ